MMNEFWSDAMLNEFMIKSDPKKERDIVVNK
jgi:hypothetical protein